MILQASVLGDFWNNQLLMKQRSSYQDSEHVSMKGLKRQCCLVLRESH